MLKPNHKVKGNGVRCRLAGEIIRLVKRSRRPKDLQVPDCPLLRNLAALLPAAAHFGGVARGAAQTRRALRKKELD
jgi:hypothetical protein